MKNFYMSITDYSEIRFLTGDITEREDPDKMLAEKGIITAKGNPSKEKMRKMDQAVDALRGKFGNDIIKRGSTLDASGRIGRKYRAQMEKKSGKSE